MCDHCGCRDQGAIGQLMRQHDLISGLAQQVRDALSDGDEVTARGLFDQLQSILVQHNGWEDRGLFARLARQGVHAATVRKLEAEHTHLHTAIEQANLMPLGWGTAITAVLDQLDAHIREENQELFPAANAVLDDDDWKAIEEAAPSNCACGGRCGGA